MTVFFEILSVLLAGFGLVCLAWLAYGNMVLPIGTEEISVRAVVLASGEGSGLEQTVSALLWLRRSGLWRGTILLADCGLDPEGLEIARRLAKQPGVELGADPFTVEGT